MLPSNTIAVVPKSSGIKYDMLIKRKMDILKYLLMFKGCKVIAYEEGVVMKNLKNIYICFTIIFSILDLYVVFCELRERNFINAVYIILLVLGMNFGLVDYIEDRRRKNGKK